MSTSSIHPPGDKIKKAIREFSEQLEAQKGIGRNSILQKVIIQFDLSPKEAEFLRRQCNEE